MRLDDQQESANVEDRRGMGAGGTIGLGTIAIAVVAYFLGFDPNVVLDAAQSMQQGQPQQSAPADPNAPKDAKRIFVGKILGSTDDAWTQIFAAKGQTYRKPTLVLFTNAVRSACGTASAATGPFYCPGDEKVYIDLSFYDELQRRFKAPGEFAQAYVIAHEVGHHIQKLTGTTDKVDALRGRAGEAEINRTSVKLELQADCYAGVWGHFADEFKHQLSSGDVEQALNAAAAIGDDRLQRQAQGTVSPESFTHGTSEQRVRWFKRGQDSGKPGDCDTFGAASL
jgi:predicted metalloprotease